MTRILPHAAHWGAFSAEVENGRLTAVRPFAHDPDPSPLITGMPDIVHGETRIDRPYVRRGWLRGDRAGGTPRGGEPFVPVDWDVAIGLVAGELARVRAEHGSPSIFGGSYGWSSAGRFHHARTQLHRMLAAFGGFTGQVTSYSYATAQTLMPHVVGDTECVLGRVVDWRAICRHARILVCFGGILTRNGQVGSGGPGAHEMHPWLRRAVAAGVRIVNVSPVRADMPADISAEWLPIRPGTDAAMMLAMAYALIEAGRVDEAFLARCTVGWERLRDYITGIADGVAKSPEWAASETGLPAETIRTLAVDCASAPAMLTAAWSIQRSDFGEQPYWLLVALAAMLGGIGKPGQGFGFGHGSMAGMGNPRAEVPSVSMPVMPNPTGSFIPCARITDMLENPGGEYDYNGRRLRSPDTRLIYWSGGNPFHHHQDLNRLQRAWARAETIVVHEPWWTATARHADIVLPATTTLEREDIACAGRDRFILSMQQALAPQHQSRNDFDIFADIAEALGVRDRFTGQRDAPAWQRAIYERCRDACALQDIEIADYDAFRAAGFVEVPVPEADAVPYADFAADPAKRPLNTPSGKIELFSATIDSFGYDDCPGHPVWRAPREYLGAPLAARFPIHLLSVQPATRLHGQLDQARVSKASKIDGREPLLMHEDDASARGLRPGDIVRVFNDRGACLAGVSTTRDILRGVVQLATGAWLDPLEPGVPGSLCVHGNPNVLTADIGTSRLGQGPSAMSCLVEIERWEGELPPVRVHACPPIEA